MKLKSPIFKYLNVMLIDDNELDNFINEKTIEAHHFAKKVYSSTSAISALEFLTNLATMGDKYKELYPEVIFIDVNMPMVDGFQFIENFNKKNRNKSYIPKMVILTSSVSSEDRMKTKAISKDIIFLNKPLTKEMLNNL